MTICKKCGHESEGNYCSNCGHQNKLSRINKQYVLNEIGSVLNFEKGILYSIRELIIRPGKSIKEFILEDRKRLVKPIIFIIICSLVYTVIIQTFHIEDNYVNYNSSKNTATTSIFKWIQENYGYANILMSVFIALWTKIFFKKYNYNFFEILILLCFIMGIGMLIFSLFAFIEGITKLSIMQVASAVGIIYSSWAIGQFFENKKIINYFKAFASYMLGFITFSLSALILGFVIDFIIQSK